MKRDFKINSDRVPEGIEKLKQEKSIWMYGLGDYAQEMLSIINSFEINLEGIIVSDDFKKQENFFGYKVFTYTEIQKIMFENNKIINIICGFQILSHPELTVRLCISSFIEHLYVLRGIEVLWFSKSFQFHSKIYLIDNYYNGLLKRDLNYTYFKENEQKFNKFHEWLQDDLSKRTMEQYLEGHVELTNFPMTSVWKKEYIQNQYFPEGIIQLNDNEVFVDCGAYTGDTVKSFFERVNKCNKYYAMEPDKRRYEDLNKEISKHGDMVMHVPVGGWSKKGKLNFSIDNTCGGISEKGLLTNGDESIDVDKIDNIVEDINSVTFLKMDIEGAELMALFGAEEVIKNSKPKLAICMYHKREDLITIPQYIKKLVPEYKFYLRSHYVYASELVLYAVIE